MHAPIISANLLWTIAAVVIVIISISIYKRKKRYSYLLDAHPAESDSPLSDCSSWAEVFALRWEDKHFNFAQFILLCIFCLGIFRSFSLPFDQAIHLYAGIGLLVTAGCASLFWKMAHDFFLAYICDPVTIGETEIPSNFGNFSGVFCDNYEEDNLL